MPVLIACSNFGECDLADDVPRWDEFTTACPRCNKSLASPHRVTLSPAPTLQQEGDACSLSVTIETAGCAHALSLALDLNGREIESFPPVKEGLKTYSFELGGLPRGLYSTRAVLKTSDGRTTRSGEQFVLIGHPPDPFTLWVGALVLILILSLSVGLFWVDQPLFKSEELLVVVRDTLSIIIPLVIGGLFLYLAFRERAFWRAAPEAGDPAIWRQRSLIRRQLTDDTVPYNIPRARQWLDSGNLWIVLSLIGGLPIYFLLVRLLGRLGMSQWDAAVAILVPVVSILGVLFAFSVAAELRKRAQPAAAAQDQASPSDSAQQEGQQEAPAAAEGAEPAADAQQQGDVSAVLTEAAQSPQEEAASRAIAQAEPQTETPTNIEPRKDNS